MYNTKKDKFILKLIADIFWFSAAIIGCYVVTGKLLGVWYHELNLMEVPTVTSLGAVWLKSNGEYLKTPLSSYVWIVGLYLTAVWFLLMTLDKVHILLRVILERRRYNKAVRHGYVVRGAPIRGDRVR